MFTHKTYKITSIFYNDYKIMIIIIIVVMIKNVIGKL